MNVALDRGRPTLSRAAVAVAVALLAGCAAAPSRDDPLEPMNRALYEFHDTVDTAVVKPVAQAYIDVVPELIRTGVSNVFNNIEDLISAVNGLLQGKLDKFGDDLGRVVLNTAFGVGGIFDLASMVGIERGNEDFGQTLGRWGLPAGPYVMLPVFGPSSVRDTAGFTADLFTDPKHYINDNYVAIGLAGMTLVDKRAELLATDDVLNRSFDRYTFIRNAYLQRRQYLLYDGKPPPEPEEP